MASRGKRGAGTLAGCLIELWGAQTPEEKAGVVRLAEVIQMVYYHLKG